MFWSCSNIIIPLIWTRSKSVNYLSYCYLSYLNKIIILSHLSTLSEQDHSIISFIYLIWTDHLTYLPYLNKIIVLSHLSILSELTYLPYLNKIIVYLTYLSYLNKIIISSHLSILSEQDHCYLTVIYLIWTRSLLSHCYLSYLNKIIVYLTYLSYLNKIIISSHLSILSEQDHCYLTVIYLIWTRS